MHGLDAEALAKNIEGDELAVETDIEGPLG
jgi:hypothetical protein